MAQSSNNALMVSPADEFSADNPNVSSATAPGGGSLRIGDLVEPASCVPPEMAVRDVKQMLSGAEPMSALVVARGEKPVGLVMSLHLDRMLSRQFGVALFSSKAVSKVMDHNPVIVDCETPLDVAASLVMQRERTKIFDHLIVTRGGLIMGVVAVPRILETLARLESERRIQLARLANKLKEEAIERQIVAESLRNSREMLKTVIESLPHSIYWKDADLFYMGCNSNFAKEAGLSSLDQVIGGTDFQMQWPNGEAELLTEWDSRIVRSHEPVHQMVERESGKAFIEIRKIPMFDAENDFIGILGIHEDVTRKELAARAMASNRAKSQFLANMSHEIRTPMNGVLGMAELLLGTQLDEHQRHLAETVFRSGESLLRIINDILDFSKIEAGKLELECIDFDLRDQIEEVMQILADKAHRKGLEFICHIEKEVPGEVRGDPGRLRQILTNLVGNAIKFTETGEVMVRVSLLGEQEDSVSLGFEVRDTGIGIPKDAQARIFDPFAQSDGSMSRRFGGTGLGLSISSQLCALMGGEIGIESTPGSGSIFRFQVRVKKQQTDGSAAGLCMLRHPHAVRVLVVDDNETNRAVLKYQLDSWGIANDNCDNGLRALELLRNAVSERRPYNLVILDMMMPGMDGLELAQRIKSDTSISEIVLIMLTSLGQYGDIEKAHRAGIATYLAKPARQSQLYNAILDSLGGGLQGKASPLPNTSSVRTDSTPILLAEDNPVNQQVCMAMLENLGYCRIDVVSNGREALEALRHTSYELVLLDCQMPELDGYETVRQMRKNESEGRRSRTPVIALTAHAMEGAMEECLAAGMDDYLSKPFTLHQIHGVLDRWLRKTPRAESALSKALPPEEKSCLSVRDFLR